MECEDQIHHLNWRFFLLKNIITTEPFKPWPDLLSQFNAQENLEAQAVSLTYQSIPYQHSWTLYRAKN